MTAEQLQAEIEFFGFDTDQLAARLKMSPRTISQYLKPSRMPREDFVNRVLYELKKVLSECRQMVRLKNSSQFSATSFRLYHDMLPIAPIEKLCTSLILPHRPMSGYPPNANIAHPSGDWKAEALQRAQRVYALPHFAQGDHATILMGSPGSGKTTEMKRLLLYLQSAPLNESASMSLTCIFVPLSIYNSGGVDSIFAAARSYYVDKLRLRLPMDFDRFLCVEIREKNLVLLLDSLDEANVPFRHEVIHHVNDLDGSSDPTQRVPTFITSRYVPPRLDQEDIGLRAALRWHLAGLDPAGVVRHIEMLRDQLLEIADEDNGLGARSMIPILQNYRKHFALLAGHLRSLLKLYDNLDPASSDYAHAVRTFAGLSQPLFLHLYVGLCLDRGVVEWSIDSIVGRYIEFLLGKWIGTRSENPELMLRNLGKASLERVLSYLGFELTLREHMGQADPESYEVETMLIAYCKAMDQASKTDEELTRFVRDQMDRARTAEIFEPDSPHQVRFGAPANVLREYHLAQFIEQSTLAFEAERYRSRNSRLVSQEFPQIDDAAYSQFLTNPNLRFLERGHVLHFQSMFQSGKHLAPLVRIRFEEARELPLVRPELCRCTVEELKQILPLNLMFLGRALEGDVTDDYKELQEQLRKDIEPIYDTTHFEKVYRALRNIVHPWRENPRPLSDKDYIAQINNLNPDDPEHVALMNHLWRVLPNSRLLIHLANKVQSAHRFAWSTLSRERQILLRRIAYELRYHASTFSQEACSWLIQLHRLAEENVKDMVMGTQRVLRTSLAAAQSRKFDWRYFIDAENRDKVTHAGWRKNLILAWGQSSGGNQIERFVRQLVEDSERFPIRALQHETTNLGELLRKREFSLPDAITILSRLLPSTLKQSEEEGKVLLLLRKIASTFPGQQLLMPVEYRLKSLKDFPGQDARYSPEEIIQLLFERALPHLVSADKLDAEEAGMVESYDGRGLQPYDSVVETIWAIFWNGHYSRDAREEI